MVKGKKLGTALLSLVLAAAIAFPVTQTLLVNAAEHTGSYGTVTTGIPEQASRGGAIFKQLQVLTNPNPFLGVTFDLKEEKAFPDGEEVYLAIKVGSARAPSDINTIDLTIAFENEGNDRIVSETGDSTNNAWAVPAVNGNGTIGEASWRANSQLMFRNQAANTQCTIDNTIIFLPFSHYFQQVSGENMSAVRYFTIASIVSTYRWQEFRSFSLVTLDGLTPLAAANGKGYKGFSVAGGAQATAQQVLDAMDNEVMLVDFMEFNSQAELDAKFDSGDWTTQVNTASSNATTRAALSRVNSSRDNNARYKEIATFEMNIPDEEEFGVNLNASIRNALVLGLDPESVGNNAKDKTASNYDNDNYTYLELWQGAQIDVSGSEGFALKLKGLSDKSCAFRIYLYSADGTRYAFAAGDSTSPTRDQSNSFITEDGRQVGFGNYHSCVWVNKSSGAGTMYYPYAALVKTGAANGEPAGSGPARIQNIARVVVGFDFDAIADFATVITRSMIFGMLADVKLDGTITPIFDPAEYTYATDAADTTKDVNPANPMNGQMVKPNNKGNDASVSAKYQQPLAYKNEAWVLRQPTFNDLLSRPTLKQATIGDVRVYNDFSMPAGTDDLSDEEKNQVFNMFSATVRTSEMVANAPKSYGYLYDNSARGYNEALKWTIGDYASEYVTGQDLFCVIDFNAATCPNNFGTLKYQGKEPLGVTVYIENQNDTYFHFNIETTVRHSVGEYNGKIDRWSCYNPGTRIYYYDMNTGREFSMIMNFGTSTIRVPAHFSGWIRFPFSEMAHPAWTANNASYAMLDYIDFDTDTITAIVLNSNMQDNTNKTVIIDNFGLYYGEFSVGSSFHTGANSMKKMLASTDFFN